MASLLLSAAAAAVAQAGAPSPLKPLRMVTYNIHHGAGNDQCAKPPEHGGDCGLDLERIAQVLMTHQPDVIALQEVDRFWKRSAGVDQAAAFARLLGMQPCYGANLNMSPDRPDSPSREYGTLILSRYPIRRCENHLLPKASDDAEQRGVLRADIDVDGRVVSVWNTHLHIRQADRLLQTKAIAERLTQGGEAPLPAVPVVLLGDLNARPGTAELEPLLRILRDAWDLAGDGDGLTSPAEPGKPPRNRIDYILVSPGIEVSSVLVDRSAEAEMASDHYPVAAILRLP